MNVTLIATCKESKYRHAGITLRLIKRNVVVEDLEHDSISISIMRYGGAGDNGDRDDGADDDGDDKDGRWWWRWYT